MVQTGGKEGCVLRCEEVYKYEGEWKDSWRPSEENMVCVLQDNLRVKGRTRWLARDHVAWKAAIR